jgi:beta-lactamase class A
MVMPRPQKRTSQLAAVSVFAVLAAGCASISTTGAASGGSATPVARSTPTPGTSSGSSTASPGSGSKTKTSPSTKPDPQVADPFTGLDGYVAGTGYHMTAAVYDRKTGQTWILDPSPGVPEHTASIVKVEIMGAVLKEHNDKGIALSSSEQSLMTSMIEASDNDSATSLWYDAGGPSGVQGFDNKVGMAGTTASTLQWIPGSTDLPGWGWTTTTAVDQVRLMRDFAYPNKLLSDADRSYGLGLMESIESDQNWGVTAGVAAGSTVALKNGWLPLNLTDDTDWQDNSIGWIKGHGRDYVLAVLCQGSDTEQGGIDAIEYISTKVYAALG